MIIKKLKLKQRLYVQMCVQLSVNYETRLNIIIIIILTQTITLGMEDLAFGRTRASIYECFHRSPWLWISYCEVFYLLFHIYCKVLLTLGE